MKNKEQFQKGAKINGIQTTVLSINSIIHNFDGLISLNRISTNPLEHRFGLMRDMSNYKHGYDTFIKMEIENLIMKDIEKNVISNLVSSRKAVFSEIIKVGNKKIWR